MKIGIVSDSHGKAKVLEAAVNILTERGAELIVHCGDLGSTACLEVLGLSGLDCYAVAGNMDRHIDRLATTADRCGVNFDPDIVVVPLDDDQCLAATHGDNENVLDELVQGGQFPYVCHGHTHRIRDERVGAVRVVSPGALRHPKHPRHPTAAMLDTRADSLEHIPIKG